MEKILEKWQDALKNPSNVDRFWDKVDRKGASECWPWLASRQRQGYGQFHLAGRLLPAPRVAYAIANPVDPVWRRSNICHSCDNPICCNPNHLWQGSYGDNSLDKIQKGRHQRKLSAEAVIEIRQTAINYTAAKECARKFGISAEHARSIARGLYWRTT